MFSVRMVNQLLATEQWFNNVAFIILTILFDYSSFYVLALATTLDIFKENPTYRNVVKQQ